MLKATIATATKKYIPRYDSAKASKTKATLLKSYQLFVSNFFNPNTPYSRLLLKWETGTGKTLGACTIASNFLSIIRDLNTTTEFNGSVFILGFSEEIFKRELLKFPEFGFITEQELQKLNSLREQAVAGSRKFQEEYRELRSKYRRRLVSRKGNGFFKFLGYRAVANRIFISKMNVSSMDRSEIIDKINSGEIRLNSEFLDEFANSLIICDEIHNLYNSVEKNNWGVAIELILNYTPSCRALFLSATPINNSPTEIVDLLNLLLPRDKYPIMQREDFFNEQEELLPEGIEKLKVLLRGRVSFVRDVNPARFASKELVGERLPGTSFLRFIRCKMSPFHQRTYEAAYKQTEALSQDAIYVNDAAFPDPGLAEPYKGVGVYKTRDIRTKYGEATQAWKSKFHLHLAQEEVEGSALAAEENLADISTKYLTMVQHLQRGLKEGAGKAFIYHNSKQITGVLFIEAILKENGFISLGEEATPATLCVHCGEPFSAHKKAAATGGTLNQGAIHVDVDGEHWTVIPPGEARPANLSRLEGDVLLGVEDKDGLADETSRRLFGGAFLHVKKAKGKTPLQEVMELAREQVCCSSSRRGGAEQDGGAVAQPSGTIIKEEHAFEPARFIMVHGDMDKKEVNHLLEQFNKASNTAGNKIMYIVGSRFMRESYTLFAVRNVYVMSRPYNINMLMQIIGRAVRDGVHELLPQAQRHVIIKLFVSSLANGLSHEELKYIEKINSNKVVRNLEAIINASAIDALINREMIWRKDQKADELDIEPFTPLTKEIKNIPLKESSFWAYHARIEVSYVEYMIKRLYVEISPVWKYADLWAAVQSPPFDTTIDPKLIDQELFNIAFNNLIHTDAGTIYRPLFASSSVIIIRDQYYTIQHFGEYYILCNFDPVSKEVGVDIESFNRVLVQEKPRSIELRDYISFDEKSNYANKRDRFVAEWGLVDFKNLKNAIYSFGVKFHNAFIEEVVAYIHDFYLRKATRHKLHDFYFRILQYYGLYNIIIYASDLQAPFASKYSSLVSGLSESRGETEVQRVINQTSPTWISTGMVNEYAALSKKADELVKKGSKPPADVLPVGHHMGAHARLYIGGQWSTEIDYGRSEGKENPIIVGYEERYDDYVDIKFKLRSPIQNIQKHKDTRLIEKGIVCQTKNKGALIDICKKLQVPLKGKEGTTELCAIIKANLLYRELKERAKKSGVRWYYSFFEQQPQLS